MSFFIAGLDCWPGSAARVRHSMESGGLRAAAGSGRLYIGASLRHQGWAAGLAPARELCSSSLPMALTTRFLRSGSSEPKGVRTLAVMLPYLARYKGRALATLCALIVAALATLAMPLAIRWMIDVGFSSSNAGFVNRIFLALVAIAGVLALASSARYYLVMTLGERIVADLAARRLRASPRAVAGVLRHGTFRRDRLPPDRRYDADQISGRSKRLDSAPQPGALRRRRHR